MNKLVKIFFLILILGLCFYSQIVLAGSGRIYVNENHEGEEKGTKDEPYKTIAEALKEASSGDSIYIKNGTYEEDLEISEGINLYGEDRSETIIKNSKKGIIAKGNNHIEELTITGGYDGITFEEDGEIENCYIKDAEKNAINLTAESDNFFLKNSKIKNNGKGIYVQRGRKIEIENNEFEDNREEGLDIRSEVKGYIKNNIISNNAESGIEIILGGSKVLIEDNIIKKNGASGIATQFYDLVSDTGNVQIKNNIISKNKKFGIRCGSPQGGKIKFGYWNESLQLDGNKIEFNDITAIDPTCKLIKAVSESEEDAQEITEDEPIEEEIDEVESAEEKEKRLKEEALSEEIKSLREKVDSFKNSSEIRLDNGLSFMFNGSGASVIFSFENSLADISCIIFNS